MDTGKKPARPAAAESPASVARRKFINSVAAAAGGGCLLALGAGLYSRSASALPAQALRPPGALPEADFLAACVRCGLCVRDCPYDTLRLADLGDPVVAGTPYFNARKVPCEMCEDIPCVKACPTGARLFGDVKDPNSEVSIAIRERVCLLVCLQLNRSGKDGERPTLAMLRDSGATEEAMDRVIAVWNPSDASDLDNDALRSATRHMRRACLLKNRKGSLGDTADLTFTFGQRLVELAPDDYR